MAEHLVVISAFGDYAVGDRITDAARVAEIIAERGRHGFVVPIFITNEPDHGADHGEG